MPVLALNQPVEQREPLLTVQNRLEPGVHRFALVVVNERGAQSEPSVISVTVRRGIVVNPGPVLVNPGVVRPDPIGPVVINPVVNPVVNPAVVNPVVRPRRRRKQGEPDGPE
jgi:hypothetical protein